MDTKQFVDQLPAIAAEYNAAPHTPEHASYRAFVADTVRQFDTLVRGDWRFELSDLEYPNSADMFADMDRHRLVVFPGGSLADGNPLGGRLYKRTSRYCRWTVNEMFRAVHDVLGHGPGRHPFETLEGEIHAYLNHKVLYSRDAWPALFGETVGQLAVHHVTGQFVAEQECKIIGVRF